MGLNDISSFEIIACFYEPQPETVDRFHQFDHTRAAPYVFYCRRLALL